MFIVGRGFRFRFVSFPVPAFITCRVYTAVTANSVSLGRPRHQDTENPSIVETMVAT